MQVIAHCRWKDEWTGRPPSYAEAKKDMKSLTLPIHGQDQKTISWGFISMACRV